MIISIRGLRTGVGAGEGTTRGNRRLYRGVAKGLRYTVDHPFTLSGFPVVLGRIHRLHVEIAYQVMHGAGNIVTNLVGVLQL